MATETKSQTSTMISDPYSNLYAVFPSYMKYIEAQLTAEEPITESPLFEQTYTVKSLQEWDEKKAEQYEMGNRIVAPDGPLHQTVLSNNTETELIIQISNPSSNNTKMSHISVLQWTAPKGVIYVPSWMIKDFGLKGSNDKLTLAYFKRQFLKGSIVQIQPHKLATLDADEFKDVQKLFEKSLRKYQCLTVGDTLRIEHSKSVHLFEITNVLSAQSIASITPFNCVSIVNTDVTIDFLPPKDYIPPQTAETETESTVDIGYDIETKVSEPIIEEQKNTEESKNAFVGIGNRLDSHSGSNEVSNDPFFGIEAKAIVIDEGLPKKRIQITLIGGKREVVQVNESSTVRDIYAHCKFVSRYEGHFKLLAGFPPKALANPEATVKDENLAGSRISQKAV